MILTLHYLENGIRAFKNVRRVLKPDGALYILDPIASRMLGHGTNPEKIVKELAVSGFRHDGFSKGFLFWTVTARPKTEVPEVGENGNADSAQIRTVDVSCVLWILWPRS
jgi:SAM-dependent methyltransferase